MSDPTRQASDVPQIVFTDDHSEVALLFPTRAGGTHGVGMTLETMLRTASILSDAAAFAETKRLQATGHYPVVALRVSGASAKTDAVLGRVTLRIAGDIGTLTYGLSEAQAQTLVVELQAALENMGKERPLQ